MKIPKGLRHNIHEIFSLFDKNMHIHLDPVPQLLGWFCCVAVQAAQHLNTEHTQESAPDIWNSGYLQTLACLKDSFAQASHSQSCLQN